MLHEKKPCYGCEKRVVGCHIDCPDYKEFKEELEIKNNLKRKQQLRRQLLSDYDCTRKAKNSKRKSDKVKYLRER